MKYSIVASLLFALASAAPAPAVTPAAELEKRQAANINVEGVGISPAEAARVQRSFSASGVVPTLIPSIMPKAEVKPNYNGKAVNLGNQFTTAETLAAPKVKITRPQGDKSTQTYSLFIVDPDVPGPDGPPVLHSPRINFLHWYVSGIGGPNKKEITFYESPTPVSPGEQHRYTFLVYREPAGYMPDVIAAQVRPGFDLSGFTRRGKLGDPIAGNFFNQSITNGIIPS